jgi:hypothetical protein
VEQYAVPGSRGKQLRLRTFDFRPRACGTLSDIGEGGESVRVARHEDGRDLLLEWSEEMDGRYLDSLSDGIFFYPVSRLCSSKRCRSDTIARTKILLRVPCCTFGSWFEAIVIAVLLGVAGVGTVFCRRPIVL